MSGGSRVLAIHAQMLQEKGHDVYIVAPELTEYFPDSRQRYLYLIKNKIKDIFSINPPDKHQLNKHPYFNQINVPILLAKGKDYVESSDVPNADIVVATWWLTAEWIASFPPEKGVKCYFVQHHELHDYLPIKQVKATYYSPFHKIVVAQWLSDYMEAEYSDKDVSLVENGVDLAQFHASPRQRQINPTVGFMYSATTWKGCNVVFEALQSVAQKIKNLKVVGFGLAMPGENDSFFDKYFYDPPQSQLREIYSRCDVWIVSSYREGFGLPLLEAMACRTPVISTAVGAAPELLQNDAGILVKPGDPDAMAQAVLNFFQMTDEEWKKMSDTAYHRASRYTWERSSHLFEQALYSQLSQGTNGPD